MGLFKDWYEDNKDYRFGKRISSFFSPIEWSRLYVWRKQRANRGWSNRDTWNAGEHIAKITSEILQHLNDNTYTDWPEWFRLNVKEEGKGAYKSLQQVIDDINLYLDFTETSWADGLDTRPVEDPQHFNVDWIDSKGKALSDQEVTRRIKKHAEIELKYYKKATKAMQFFGRHFAGFWD